MEEAGFDAVYVTGSGVSVGHLGLPDIGLATMGDLQKAAIRAMRDVTAALARDGTTAALAERMVSFEERFELVGLSRLRDLEARYRTA